MKALKRNDGLILAVGEDIQTTTTNDIMGNTIPAWRILNDPEDTVKDYTFSGLENPTILDLSIISNVPEDIVKHSKYVYNGTIFTLNPSYKGN